MRRRRPLVGVLAGLVALTGCGTTRATHEAVPPARPVANHAFADVPGSRVVAWAVGDGAAGTPAALALGRRIAADHPAALLYLGDVYETGSAAEFRAHMTAAYGPLLRRVLPTPGNHEWPSHRVGYDPYWRRITHAPTPPWYAVRLGSWQALSLNSEAAHDAGGAQVRWVRQQLRRPARCRLAFWHRPRFSAGIHGDQPDVAPLWDAVRGRATLVLNGHDHDVQRLRAVGGTTEVVDGAGGKSHYPVAAGDRRLAFRDDRRDAALRMVLTADRAVVTVVAGDGAVLDRAVVPCRGAAA